MRKQFKELILLYKPQIVVMEPPYGGDSENELTKKSGTTSSVLAGVYWLLQQLCDELKIPTEDIPAAQWQNRCSIFKRDRLSRK